MKTDYGKLSFVNHYTDLNNNQVFKPNIGHSGIKKIDHIYPTQPMSNI